MNQRKTYRMKSSSPRFMREALDLLRGYAPEVVQCTGCGHPRLMGYNCKKCDTREVRIIKARQEVLDELLAKFPDVHPCILEDVGLTKPIVAKVTLRRFRHRKRDMSLYKERMAALKEGLT
jgi:hypothetical protein